MRRRLDIFRPAGVDDETVEGRILLREEGAGGCQPGCREGADPGDRIEKLTPIHSPCDLCNREEVELPVAVAEFVEGHPDGV